MNRRNFFKSVTGFIAGIYAVFVPKTHSSSDLAFGKVYHVHYDLETKVQTTIEDGEVTETRKFKEDPFVLLNPDPTVSCVVFEKYKMV